MWFNIRAMPLFVFCVVNIVMKPGPRRAFIFAIFHRQPRAKFVFGRDSAHILATALQQFTNSRGIAGHSNFLVLRT